MRSFSSTTATAPVTTVGLAAARETSAVLTTSSVSYADMVSAMKRRFAERRETIELSWRVQQLKQLRRIFTEEESAVMEASMKDGRKPRNEAFLEIALMVGEIDHALENLHEWAAEEEYPTPLVMKPAKFKVVKQPKGVVLIIGAWNVPFYVTFGPLVGAIAAGCPCVMKPSEIAPNSAAAMDALVKKYLDTNHYRVVLGGVEETTALLNEPWAHIIYTGNGAVGRIIAAAAAKHLTPVTLELGGKSPVYVAADADLKLSAKRIMGTKLLNNAQTCVAPDYVLVENSVKKIFVADCVKILTEFLGEDPQKSSSVARVINGRHFNRLAALLKDDHGGIVACGGLAKADEKDLFIPPTILIDPRPNSRVMQEEIFGPILCVLGVSNLEEATRFIQDREPPLASYVFTSSTKTAEEFVSKTLSGSTAVNDCVFQVCNAALPFGGVSASGYGAYHGKAGFDALTHARNVMNQTTLIDPYVRYPPFRPNDVALLRWFYVGPWVPNKIKLGIKLAVIFALAWGVQNVVMRG